MYWFSDAEMNLLLRKNKREDIEFLLDLIQTDWLDPMLSIGVDIESLQDRYVIRKQLIREEVMDAFELLRRNEKIELMKQCYQECLSVLS